MLKRISSINLAAAMMLISTISAATVNGQVDSEKSVEPVTVEAKVGSEKAKDSKRHSCESCFDEGAKIVDTLPQREATENEQKIIDKTMRLINRFKSQKDAFTQLDKDHNCKLDKSEVDRLLNYAKINSYVRLIATGRMITHYDLSHDGAIQWREFHHAIDKAFVRKQKK